MKADNKEEIRSDDDMREKGRGVIRKVLSIISLIIIAMLFIIMLFCIITGSEYIIHSIILFIIVTMILYFLLWLHRIYDDRR